MRQRLHAPELIRNTRGTTFRDCEGPTFTFETDDFSLAVHVFRMLMNGVHPYHVVSAPAPNGSVPAPVPLEKRVERGETPFFTHMPGTRLPPFAPSLGAFPPYLLDLFRRAFVEGQGDPGRRPTAREWGRALAKYKSELARCNDDGAHWYWEEAPRCPYCEADREAAAVSGSLVPGPMGSALRSAAATLGSALPGTASMAAVATGPRAVHSPMSTIWFWASSMALACCVFLAACVAAPVCSSICAAIFGAYPTWMQAALLAAALAGTAWYNRNCARDTRGTTLAKAGLMSAVGIAAAIAAMAAVYLVIAIVAIVVPSLFVTAAVIALIAALLEAF